MPIIYLCNIFKQYCLLFADTYVYKIMTNKSVHQMIMIVKEKWNWEKKSEEFNFIAYFCYL